jgi:hypothetical protein
VARLDRVTFNPRDSGLGTFHLEDGTTVTAAPQVLFTRRPPQPGRARPDLAGWITAG